MIGLPAHYTRPGRSQEIFMRRLPALPGLTPLRAGRTAGGTTRRTARFSGSAPHACRAPRSGLVDDQHLIGIPHRGQPVRDDKAGSSLQQLAQRLLDQHLGAGVDLAVASSRIRMRGSASTARAMEISWRWPWQQAAALADFRSGSLGQPQDELFGVGGVGGGHHLFIAGVRCP